MVTIRCENFFDEDLKSEYGYGTIHALADKIKASEEDRDFVEGYIDHCLFKNKLTVLGNKYEPLTDKLRTVVLLKDSRRKCFQATVIDSVGQILTYRVPFERAVTNKAAVEAIHEEIESVRKGNKRVYGVATTYPVYDLNAFSSSFRTGVTHLSDELNYAYDDEVEGWLDDIHNTSMGYVAHKIVMNTLRKRVGFARKALFSSLDDDVISIINKSMLSGLSPAAWISGSRGFSHNPNHKGDREKVKKAFEEYPAFFYLARNKNHFRDAVDNGTDIRRAIVGLTKHDEDSITAVKAKHWRTLRPKLLQHSRMIDLFDSRVLSEWEMKDLRLISKWAGLINLHFAAPLKALAASLIRSAEEGDKRSVLSSLREWTKPEEHLFRIYGASKTLSGGISVDINRNDDSKKFLAFFAPRTPEEIRHILSVTERKDYTNLGQSLKKLREEDLFNNSEKMMDAVDLLRDFFPKKLSCLSSSEAVNLINQVLHKHADMNVIEHLTWAVPKKIPNADAPDASEGLTRQHSMTMW